MEHLALEIFDLTGSGSKYANLPEDASITITDTSEIFASGDVWSHSFTLNIPANLHIFGTAGDIHGSRLHEQINKRRARLWVEGLPLYLGYLKLDDEVEVDKDGNVDVTFESGQKTFEEMIEGMNARDVPMLGDHLLGVALWRQRATKAKVKYTVTGKVWYPVTDRPSDLDATGDEQEITIDTTGSDGHNARWPKYVVSHGEFYNMLTQASETIGNVGMYGTAQPTTLNTDIPYDDNAPTAHPYCNIWIAYQKTEYENGSDTPTAKRGYNVSSERRVNSAPSFFVMYWLRALMTHLGIYIEENQMQNVEDLRRLFLLNTLCAYEEPEEINTTESNARYGYYRFGTAQGGSYLPQDYRNYPTFDTAESGVVVDDFTINSHTYQNPAWNWDLRDVSVDIISVEPVGGNNPVEHDNAYRDQYGHLAYATSDCFPDKDVSEIIDALEAAFGIRFLFSDDFSKVRVVLLRNVFRNEKVQEITCDISEATKQENNIRGFRLTYGGGEENTDFYHELFNRALPSYKAKKSTASSVHSYGKTDDSRSYSEIIRNVTAFDPTVYITPNTGNAFVGKVDENAKRYKDLYPSLFEDVPFIDAEDGDCTGEDETIETVSIGFTPLVMNDVNFADERKGNTNQQQFCLFISDDMQPRRPQSSDPMKRNPTYIGHNMDDAANIYPTDGTYRFNTATQNGAFMVQSDVCTSARKTFTLSHDLESAEDQLNTWNVTADLSFYFYETYRLMLQDNFEPNDDGLSPIEKHDWGLTLGIMRGSGSDAHAEYKADTVEDENPRNDTWEIIPGSSATAHSDTCDNYGNEWDYNGSVKVTPEGAAAQLASLFPNSNAPFNATGKGYINGAGIFYIYDNDGKRHSALLVTSYSTSGRTMYPLDFATYPEYLSGGTTSEIMERDSTGNDGLQNLIVELDSSEERYSTLIQLCSHAYSGGTGTITLDNGIGSRYGRFSLKLRAEKPNPHFNPALEENSTTNRRYLEITNPNLRGRGLCDQFYKEYSYWVRNARIAKVTVRMELAQLLAIDKTMRVTVGDVTGFIRKMQYSVSNKTGLGNVTMEIMYI